MKVAFAFPDYNQDYYRRMLGQVAQSLDLDHISLQISSCRSNLYFYDVVFAINCCRLDLSPLSPHALLITWLQDCPFSIYRRIKFCKFSYKAGDHLLFAAPNSFGFSWEFLKGRQINTSYMFYGYNPEFDSGREFIRQKHKFYFSPSGRYFSRPQDIFSNKTTRVQSQAVVSLSDQLKHGNCPIAYPTFLLSGFYDKDFEDAMLEPVQKFLPLSFAKSFSILRILLFRKRINRVISNYIPFIGQLALPDTWVRFRWLREDLHSLSRSIERNLILKSILPLILQKVILPKQLFLIGHPSLTSLVPGALRLQNLDHRDYLSISSTASVIICNNTHGLGLHPRVLDGMISGSVILMHRTSPALNGSIGTMESSFIDRHHYFAWSDELELVEIIHELTHNPQCMSVIAENAYQYVRLHHSWDKETLTLSRILSTHRHSFCASCAK